MQYHHLHATEDGESHWRTVQVPLEERTFAPPAKSILVSDAEAAVATVFLRLDPGWDEPTHPTPRRQTLFCLAGAVRVTTSDGEFRMIAKGDVWRMEDTHGKGHHTCVAGDDPSRRRWCSSNDTGRSAEQKEGAGISLRRQGHSPRRSRL